MWFFAKVLRNFCEFHKNFVKLSQNFRKNFANISQNFREYFANFSRIFHNRPREESENCLRKCARHIHKMNWSDQAWTQWFKWGIVLVVPSICKPKTCWDPVFSRDHHFWEFSNTHLFLHSTFHHSEFFQFISFRKLYCFQRKSRANKLF